MSFQLPDWLKYDLQKKAERLGRWWREMPLRKWANENPRLVLGITVASVVLLLAVTIWLIWPEPPAPVVVQKKEWYYDLNTGKLFVAEVGLTPPIEAPSGPLPDGKAAGARAYVLAYTEEPNEAERFIAFLEIADPRGPADSTDPPGVKISGAKKWGRGKLLRRLEDEQWLTGDSAQGQRIFEEAFAPNENGERPRYLQPD